MTTVVDFGYVPLLDAAPLILAEELGFAAEERLHFRLHPAHSWSQLRDMVALGRVDAAQMLSVIPVAGRLGLGGVPVQFDAPMVLSLGGQVIGVSPALAEELRMNGMHADFTDATALREAMRRTRPDGLRCGVPFPFSMHHELLHLWMDGAVRLSAVTVPPSLTADALAAGEIEAFCVGEPWGSHAVMRGHAVLLLPGTAIWSAAPEKVLVMRKGWAEDHGDLAGQILRAIWRCCQWLAQPGSWSTASDLLARSNALNVDAELIERAMSGHLVPALNAAAVDSPGFVEFHAGAVNFPWRSQAAWIGWHLARRNGLDPVESARRAAECWRPDLFRQHLAGDAVLPAASAKVEGANATPILAGANRGAVLLGRNAFFDGRIFDLSALS